MANNIIVCQAGARHRYLIPQVLEKAGMLCRLYTNSTAHSTVGKIAKVLSHIGIKPAILQRLCNRLPRITEDKLFTTDKPLIKQLTTSKKNNATLVHNLYQGFANKCIKWGVSDCDCIYSMFIENFEFLKYAKEKGKKIVVDIYEMPLTPKLMMDEINSADEYSIFKNSIPNYSDNHDIRMKYMDNVLALADYYTVPSEFVLKSLRLFKNFDENKVMFLPYASSITTKEYNYHPIKHRLIWVGNDPVRKGLLYCAKAATELKKDFPDLDFRIIGSVPKDITTNPTFKDLNFLGILGKDKLTEEYSSAEAYVFPTLSEGFAGTIIEAASCGCPIITTECAGTNIEEFPAMYIQTKDVDGIVESVRELFGNSEMRDDMSAKTYEYAKTFNPKEYEKKLIEYFKSI